jgi:hypothetical protein
MATRIFYSETKYLYMFKNLNYKKWCAENSLDKLFNTKIDYCNNKKKEENEGIYFAVDPKNTEALPARLDDLARLHYLVRSRKVTTILEFGVGKSTIVFADALKKNKIEFEKYISKNLRRSNPFEVHSVDNSKKWINTCRTELPKQLIPFVHFHHSKVSMDTFNGRVCTMYSKLPNICPDLIYLDAPDQFSALGNIRGISTKHPDRVPIAADILFIEPLLLPGTLIVIDGRTANARFLLNNLQRNWKYTSLLKEDIHLLELAEQPFGKLNEKQIRFSLGDSWDGLTN